MRARKKTFYITFWTVITSLSIPAAVLAVSPQSSSTHYQVNEVFFGSGGALNSCSTSYCSKQTAGETAVGLTSSPNYQAHGGFNTARDPYLQLIVNSTNINLGVLKPGVTSTATSTFSVKSYLTNGYSVLTESPPPSDAGYNLQSLSTATASNSSAEQFGINLVSNTTACGAPANFGASPNQIPSTSFSFGAAATGYNSCGLFRYNNGDTIASSSVSSGETDYTISYLINITSTTPAGLYVMQQSLVATSTF